METQEKTISVTEFKAKCLALLENLDKAGLVLTKRGQPIAKVIPITQAHNEALIGSMNDKIEILGDIYSTGVSWDAESGHPHARRRPRRRSKR